MDYDYMATCSSPALLSLMNTLKNILSVLQIIVPIILILFITINLVKLISNPDNKKGKKWFINMGTATVFIYLLPIIVNVFINMVGPKYDLSVCWINASGFKMGNATYISNHKEKAGSIIPKREDYEEGDKKSSNCGLKIAMLAVELAGTATPDSFIKSPNGKNYCAFNKSNDPRLNKYNSVHDSRISCNHAYASCTQAAATVIDAAADPEINWMGPPAQWYYLEHSPKWQEIKLGPGQKWKDVLQPGDVGEVMWDDTAGHSWIYVGNEAVRKKFANSTGDLFQAGYTSCKNPHIDNGGDFVNSSNTNYHYFRFIGDCSEAETKNVKDGYGGPKAYAC